MNKISKLIIAGAFLLILIGVFIILRQRADQSDKINQKNPYDDYLKSLNIPDSSIMDDYQEPIKLTDLRIVDIIKLENSASGMILVRNKGPWEVATAGKRGVAIEQYMVSSRLWNISSFSAESIIEEEPDDLFQFGLDTPQNTITVTMTDGSQTILYFGHMTPDRLSRYVMKKDDPKLYKTSSYIADLALFTLDEIRRKELLPDFEPYSMTRLIIDRPDLKLEIIPNDDENLLVSAISMFAMISPYRQPRGTDTHNF